METNLNEEINKIRAEANAALELVEYESEINSNTKKRLDAAKAFKANDLQALIVLSKQADKAVYEALINCQISNGHNQAVRAAIKAADKTKLEALEEHRSSDKSPTQVTSEVLSDCWKVWKHVYTTTCQAIEGGLGYDDKAKALEALKEAAYIAKRRADLAGMQYRLVCLEFDQTIARAFRQPAERECAAMKLCEAEIQAFINEQVPILKEEEKNRMYESYLDWKDTATHMKDGELYIYELPF